jgi:hypothetical protein
MQKSSKQAGEAVSKLVMRGISATWWCGGAPESAAAGVSTAYGTLLLAGQL